MSSFESDNFFIKRRKIPQKNVSAQSQWLKSCAVLELQYTGKSVLLENDNRLIMMQQNNFHGCEMSNNLFY